MAPEDAVRRMGQIQQQLLRNLRAAEAKSLREGKKIAMHLSSGTISTEQLRRMGHSYAASHSALPQDPQIINRQSGLFRRSWRTKILSVSTQEIKSEIENTAPYAHFLDTGTMKMVMRPIKFYIQKELAPIRLKNAQDALRYSLK